MACNSLVGRNWGLKPRIVYWIYTSIVRPILTYAAFVWWTKTTQRAVQRLLSRIQRLAILAITGCRRTTPTVALEALLELPALPTFITKEAALTSYRLFTDIRPKPGDYTGHLKIYREFPDLVGVREVSDQIPIEFEFDMTFDLVIPDRLDWHDGLNPLEDHTIFYTDGSKKDDRTGAGIFGPGIRAWFPMGTVATVFEAEVYAIDACARRCLARNDLRRKKIAIASDSQAALRAIGSSTFRSRLVLECRRTLNELGKQSRLTLAWVPGHSGISGNEAADELAKKGSETNFIGPEPFCAFGLGNRREILNAWEKKEMLRSFSNNLGIDSHSRYFIECGKYNADKILTLCRTDIRLLVGIFTGHCGLLAHQHRIGRSDEKRCRFCKEVEETPIHILCECEALAQKRNASFGNGFPTILDIRQMDFQKILTFIKKLGLGNI